MSNQEKEIPDNPAEADPELVLKIYRADKVKETAFDIMPNFSRPIKEPYFICYFKNDYQGHPVAGLEQKTLEQYCRYASKKLKENKSILKYLL